MNDIELNAILYYADFLSLRLVSHPITDNCKYFFIHGTPINSLYILDLKPIYDENDPYFQQALNEYKLIKNKFGEEGIESFIDDICSIKACGTVDAKRMLKCIHLYSTKPERKRAFNAYNTWKNKQIYTHTIVDEHGKPKEVECTLYFFHTGEVHNGPTMEKSIQ